MTPSQHRSLSELAARFRRRAESAQVLGMEYGVKARKASLEDPLRELYLTDSVRNRAQGNTWATAADELEAFLKTAEAQEVEARG